MHEPLSSHDDVITVILLVSESWDVCVSMYMCVWEFRTGTAESSRAIQKAWEFTDSYHVFVHKMYLISPDLHTLYGFIALYLYHTCETSILLRTIRPKILERSALESLLSTFQKSTGGKNVTQPLQQNLNSSENGSQHLNVSKCISRGGPWGFVKCQMNQPLAASFICNSVLSLGLC